MLELKSDLIMAFWAVPLETTAVVVTHLVSDRWSISENSCVARDRFDDGSEDI